MIPDIESDVSYLTSSQEDCMRIAVPLVVLATSMAISAASVDQVKVASGILEGSVGTDASVRLFKGVPFAAPPVGDLRWKAPQPVTPWKGVRKADTWPANCIQGRVFADIVSRGKEMGEDCLYLNIWTTAKGPKDKRPVFVWYHGGGFVAGSGSEPRYDGEYLAKQGIVVVNVNYRLGVFGFFSHPELTKESPQKASGNYGLLDQVEALKWVQANIAAFGGDPNSVTIGGESAGSFSVSALMASPLCKGLIHKAIGESGAFLSGSKGTLAEKSLTDAEKAGEVFADSIGAKTLADLRAKKAEDLLAEAGKGGGMRGGFSPIVDGYFLPATAGAIYAKGEQARVPLLAGWNSSEMGMAVAMNPVKPTIASFSAMLQQQFKDKGEEALKVYSASTDEEAAQSMAALISDQFIVYSTWKWADVQAKVAPVYRFQFDRVVPDPAVAKSFGAAHAVEIEYVFNTLDSKKAAWQPEDRKTAQTMATYWANFIKTGNPNGAGLSHWPEFGKSHQVMHLDATSKALPEQNRARYEFLDAINGR